MTISSVLGGRKIAMSLAVTVLVAAFGSIVILRGDSDRTTAASCPPGYQLAEAENEPQLPDGAVDGRYRGGPGEIEMARGTCVNNKHPESFGELALANSQLSARQSAPYGAVRAGALLHALRQRRAVERSSSAQRISGSAGSWRPLGKGPLNSGVEGYGETSGLGLRELGGRISDFAINPKTNVVFAAVANGGVWRSKNFGTSWTSVGNKLPTQIVGSVGYSPVNGGTVIAATGDNAFGGSSLSGLGVYRTTNGGRSWKRAKGVPGGALGFKVAVDPSNPKKIYAATGFGLYRSTNGAKSFKNVRLPTGSPKCIGHPYRRNCFLRNMVTDVV
ncbi:MAG: hypothetical protein QOH90_1670, partial [Actinomycetota bacterium]|nr:hypothetical protein [Actinomycetota bacterium]